MSTTFTPPEAGHFRPVSMSDFQISAKHLAWLSGLQLQRSQELLAQIYGYSGLHELQRVMAIPGEAGPFSHQWDGPMASQVGRQLFYADPKFGGARFYRTLDLLGEATGYDRTTLPPRLDRVTDLLIFDPPAQQREAFRLLRSKLDIMEGKDAGGKDRLVTEYAFLDREFDVPILRFTDLGRAIYDSVQDLLPDHNGRSVSRFSFEECAARVEAIAHRHPNNPWPSALFITTFAELFFQGGWADNLPFDRDRGLDIDADPGFKRVAKINALNMLPYARTAIALFEELYGAEKANTPDHKSYISDVDTFTWPAVLYWGGLVALNAGEGALAKRWLTLHSKIVPDDNFGARFYLTAIALNEGKPKITYKKGYIDHWTRLARAAQLVVEGKLEEAIKPFGDVLENTWAAIEIFSTKWPAARRCRIGTNHDSVAYLEEFLFRTAPFWKQHPEVKAIFSQIARSSGLREAVLAYHKHDSEFVFGSALRGGVEESMKVQAQAKLLEADIRNALALAVKDIGASHNKKSTT